jgi:N-acetylmuramoyl-L-alanine amidase
MKPDMLVLHYTGMPSAEEAMARLCNPAAKVSSHYTIDREGRINVHVPEARRAWHAGVSIWRGATDINARSIGIELVNPGHEFGYIPFTDDQIAALIVLAKDVVVRQAISPARVLGHSDVAPSRKDDPGELFPWKRLAENGVGLWPHGSPILKEPFREALTRYGYDPAASDEKVITAFQRHFRPETVNGQWDETCEAALASLLAQAVPIA